MIPVVLHFPVGDNPPKATFYYGQDVRHTLKELPDGSVQTICTSPPYWGLRDYKTGTWEGGDPDCDHKQETKHQTRGHNSACLGRSNVEAIRNENFRSECGKCGARRIDDQIGLEETPELYTQHLVEVFQEARRVLRDDGDPLAEPGGFLCWKWGRSWG